VKVCGSTHSALQFLCINLALKWGNKKKANNTNTSNKQSRSGIKTLAFGSSQKIVKCLNPKKS